MTLSSDTPGFFIILAIGLILAIMGVAGLVFYLNNFFKANKGQPVDETSIKGWFSLIKSLDVVLVLGLLFRAFIIQPFIVDGASMESNFHNNEAILVDKISFRLSPIKRGEVIIFKAPKNPVDDYIKRVIGLPGEKVTIASGKVFINGSLLSEPYLASQTVTLAGSGKTFQITVAPNQYFVLGDNRSNSSDSRDWGLVPNENIIGRAWLIVYPLSDKGFVTYPQPVIEKNKPLTNFSHKSLKYFLI